jgi:hypothetical protein
MAVSKETLAIVRPVRMSDVTDALDSMMLEIHKGFLPQFCPSATAEWEVS